MSLAEDFHFDDELHPIDMVETLAAGHRWDFDRVADDQIAMSVEGLWRSYALTLAWSEQDETLRLICTYEMEPPEARLPALYECINRCNDQVWAGAFTWWPEQRLMVWRYGLPLAGGAIVGSAQLDQMIAGALSACERFYPAFQLVCRGDRSPAEAMGIAMAEARGHA